MHEDVWETIRYCKYRVFAKGDDLEDLYRLRYECYRAEGSIPQNARKMMTDPYDESPNCVHAAVEFGGTLLSAVRLHFNSDWAWSSPTLDVFPDVLNAVPDGQTILDPTRFVVRPEAREAGVPLHIVTMRIATLAALFYDIDISLAPVREEHFAFYRRYLGYDVWAKPRPYPGLKKPIGLLAARPRDRREKVLAKFPYFGPVGPIVRSEIYFPDHHRIFGPSQQTLPRVA